MTPGAEPSDRGRRFHVLETLGTGGFGVVYRAEAAGHGGFTKQVALKVLRKDIDLSGGVAERLRDEARILGLLNHRSVVKVDGLIELENGWAIVMEYVSGVNLTSLVRRGCPPAAAAQIVSEVAGALHAAWSDVNAVTGEPLRLVHRDIKPANIRVTPQGEVKVLDFGVARADFADREAETVSVLFGSMRYMAPERLDGIEGPSGDVFALAIVFAELLCGRRFDEPPKNAKRHADWLQTVCDLAVADLPELDRGPTRELLCDALAYEDEARPTALEFRRRGRRLAARLPGPPLLDFAEANVGLFERADSERRAARANDAVDSVLIEQGSQAHRPEVTGITRSRALVGGALAGVGVLGAATAAAAGLILVAIIALLSGGVGSAPTPTSNMDPASTAPPAAPEPAPVPPPPNPEPSVAPTEDAPPPAPAPAPTPPAAPAPRPTVPEPSKPVPTSETTVVLTGDLGTVQLRGAETQSLTAGPNGVPPGTYGVHAAFEATAPAAQVAVVQISGPKVTLHCSAMLYTCRIQ